MSSFMGDPTALNWLLPSSPPGAWRLSRGAPATQCGAMNCVHRSAQRRLEITLEARVAQTPHDLLVMPTRATLPQCARQALGTLSVASRSIPAVAVVGARIVVLSRPTR